MTLSIWIVAAGMLGMAGVPVDAAEEQPQLTNSTLIERLGLRHGKWISEVAIGAVNMDSAKGSIDLKPNASVETVEDCLSEDTIRRSDLFLPGMHFNVGNDCSDDYVYFTRCDQCYP